MTYKLGSLFDGSGGFPLAGFLCDIEPVWAAEIEPYPIAVTRSRFPMMKHYGDISKINGAEIEPVDIITFGSPCQDLSVAGKRAGLKHENNGDDETTRSGLFMEAVRIIKEMREATNGKYPTFALWENVPGAFSSNKGEDFRIVLEELIKIVEPGASMPSVPKKGWSYSDSYLGDGWSLAYRVFDAQYWGVPQRRRRIYLVLDLGGEHAREVLFEREGLRGYFTEGRTPWEGTSTHAEGSLGTADYEREVRGAVGFDSYNLCETGDVGRTVTTASGGLNEHIPCVIEARGIDGYNFALADDNAAALGVNCGVSTGRSTVLVPQKSWSFEPGAASRLGGCVWEEVAGTLRATPGDNLLSVCIETCENDDKRDSKGNAYGIETFHCAVEEEMVPTLKARDWKDPHVVAYSFDPGASRDVGVLFMEETAKTITNGTCPGHHDGVVIAEGCAENPIVLDRAFFNQEQNALYEPQCYEDGTVPTLVARGPSAVAYWDGSDVCGTLTANNAGGNQRMPDKDNFNCVIEKYNKPPIRYIVRRLTPTECARLQGFADRWGDIDEKESFTEEEYEFWFNVRNTHAEINGKTVKEYTKEQMLAWYKKLQSDSAEYKMWGNGISLPTALYCMQGIVDALRGNRYVEKRN